MSGRKMRLLALHGKGTSGRILKTQLKPILDAVSNVLEVHYIDGGELSAPYQGIESIFPKQKYCAWYEQPTCDALQTAHDRVALRLIPSRALTLKPDEAGATSFNAYFPARDVGLLTPPETPSSDSPPASTDQALKRREATAMPVVCSDGGYVARWGASLPLTGMETPMSCPSTGGLRTPLDADFGSYDGLICFSQGCAVSTGLLLELADKLGHKGTLPVRFAIFICGGRPFEAHGSMERVQAKNVRRIAIPSIHIIGRQDPNFEESKKLASLYSDAGKEVLELDIGHCPPRRTWDANLVAAAIRRTIAGLK